MYMCRRNLYSTSKTLSLKFGSAEVHSVHCILVGYKLPVVILLLIALFCIYM